MVYPKTDPRSIVVLWFFNQPDSMISSLQFEIADSTMSELYNHVVENNKKSFLNLIDFLLIFLEIYIIPYMIEKSVLHPDKSTCRKGEMQPKIQQIEQNIQS